MLQCTSYIGSHNKFMCLPPRTRNWWWPGDSGFVLGVYYYTMRAVGTTDELQVTIHKLEDMKNKDAGSS
jgi:hypothetical protein